jgi:hypothetical protein
MRVSESLIRSGLCGIDLSGSALEKDLHHSGDTEWNDSLID